VVRWSALLVLTLSAVSAGAQTPVGPEFRVNTSTTGDQRYAAVASDAAGNFVVVWTTDGQDGDAGGIFGRRFDASGSPLGGEFQVNTYTTDNQFFPTVASDAAGNFVVVWESGGQDGNSFGVFGRRFGADGDPTTPEFQVNTYTTSVQVEPAVAFDGSGGFVVVWESYFQDGSISSLFGQRFDAAGNRVGTEFQVNSYTTSGQYRPDVAADAAGNFVVVWESDGQEGSPSSYGIFARRFDSAGQPEGDDFQVNVVTAGSQRHPSVVADRSGAFTVAWSTPASIGVVGRRYDAAGAPLGGEFGVNTYMTGTASGPDIAVDVNGNFVVSWTSGAQDGSGSGVSARRFDCAGLGLSPDFLTNTHTLSSQHESSIAAGAGNFVVVWRSADQDGSGDGVFGQLFRGLPACGRFYALAPCRVADTRQTPGPSGGPALGANSARDFPVAGLCNIPADARAVAVNLTTTNQTELGNLRLYPAGEAVPLASAINFSAGQARANNAVVRLGAAGGVGIRCDMAPGSTGQTDVIVDVFGYFK
jgi:hypothetical protein